MKVLLKQDVENLGYAGEVHKVADGYGRNFLLPRSLAEVASPSALKKASAWRERAEARRNQMKAEYAALAEKIQGVSLEFSAKAGDSGKLYGSITPAAIVDALNEKLGAEIDRRKVRVDPLRQLGDHSVTVRLDTEYAPKFNVTIVSEDDEEDEVDAADVDEAITEAVADADDAFDADDAMDVLDAEVVDEVSAELE